MNQVQVNDRLFRLLYKAEWRHNVHVLEIFN